MKGSPYRSGPWPGVTPQGAAMLLACAAFLAVGQVLIGPVRQPLPDLVVLGVTALIPLAIAERIIKAPGAATAACGAYLLPRSLVSLLDPAVPPPALLLVPAITFDVAMWLDPSHLSALQDVLPGRLRAWGRRASPSHAATSSFSRGRAVIAGGAFGLIMALVEPSYQMFLGAAPAVWSGPALWVAMAATTLVCAAVAAAVTVRGRES